MRIDWSVVVLGAVAVLGLTAATAPSERIEPVDPLTTYPENYRVLLENERVRVLNFTLRKSATEVIHRHRANVAVFPGEFRIRFTFPDGRTAIRDAHLGDVGYSEAVVHASENIGDTDAHGIPGREQDLRQHLLSLAAPTPAEEGCITYDLYRSPDRPHEFMRPEVRASPLALEPQKQTPHLRASFAKRQAQGWTTQILT